MPLFENRQGFLRRLFYIRDANIPIPIVVSERNSPMHTPPFCPNPHCVHHWYHARPHTRWWSRSGTYSSRRAGSVQRFQCTACGHRFSESTFSPHYFTKKHLNLYRLKRLISNGSSIRAAARHLFVSPSTISHRVMLLARQSLAAHAALTPPSSLAEHLVADGFQSFSVSQFHPNNFNILVGATSQYLYAMTNVTLRRSGRMTPRQRRIRDTLDARYPPDPHDLPWSFRELLLEAERVWSHALPSQRVLRTDMHTVYPRCVAQCSLSGIRHITVSSTRPRTVGNPLFAVNYIDREMRKDLAEHHRETMCFARSEAMSVARAWIYLVGHNIEKAFRIAPEAVVTHAEVAGIPREEVRRVKRKLLTERAFLSRSWMSHWARRVWMGMIATPERENRTNRRVTPGYCMA